MFLTKMVREFINSIKNSNSNQHQNHQKTQHQPQTNQTRSSGNSGYNNKSNKKSAKTKKSLTKSDSLNNNNNNSNSNSNKDLEKEHLSSYPSTSKVFENYKSKSSKPVAKAASQTKVKSGSWKRSEKSLNPYNATLPSNKKPKTLRKRSPTWLQFQSSKVKLQDLNTPAITNEQTSNCRPGTLYSDVLFGAGCSNLVKIKNITPRRTNCTTAQKKLTKALQKFTAKEHETSDDDEFKTKRLSFPSLDNANNKMSSPTFTNSTVESETVKTAVSLETISNQESSLTTDTTNTTSTPPSSPNKYHHHHQRSNEDEADVVILSELNGGASTSDNNVSYGHYLEQHCLHLVNGKTEAAAATAAASSNQDKRFLVSSICDIPKWNFMDFDTSSDAFPKFLGQFDDENYLKAEKMAWLGLKLALGNNPSPNKYKFQ